MRKDRLTKIFQRTFRIGIRHGCKIILLLFLVFTIFACQKSFKRASVRWMEGDGRIKVLTTIAQIGDLAAEVGGERVDVYVLIRGDLDPHSYELVKGDDELLARAEIIFYNGLGLEHGASLREWLHRSHHAVALGDAISSKNILYMGEVPDPHIWMDISLWAEAIEPIVKKLTELDPEGASYYEERAGAFRATMLEAHEDIKSILHRVPAEKRYLVTSHDAFQYFTRSYLSDGEELDWRERFEAPEGLAPDGQLSALDIRRIIAYLKTHGISMLFPESNVSKDSIRKIAAAGREIGLKIRICEEPLYGDAMDAENLHYLDTMRHNALTIANHLSEE